jgi:PAS domain S-box-containing protein
MKEDNKTKKQLIDELTELRSQNAALKKSESAEKYRSLVENIRDVIYELDSQGVVLYISPAIRDLLGYDSAEIVGKNFIELAHKDDLSSLAEWFSELRKGVESQSEYRVINKSGELRWARTKTRPIMEDGLFKGARGIIIDVTAQRRVEEALRDSEKKYRLAVDNMADVITIMDMNLRFTYVSPSMMRMRGYTVEEATAQTLEQIMTPESMQIIAKTFEEEMKLEAGGTADPGRSRVLELEQYRKDGSIVWIETSLSFIRDEAQKPVGIISSSHDITDRKRAEDNIKQQTDAMEAAIDGMALLNEDGKYSYLNKAHVKIYGYENAGELIGKSWRTLYDADEIQRFDAEIMPEFRQEGYWQGEALGMKKDGSKFPQELSLTALESSGLICVVRDITDRKRAEEVLKESEKKYRLLADNINDVIFVLDMNFNFTYASPSIKILMGYEPKELLGQPAIEAMTPSSWDLAIKTISEVIELKEFEHSKIPTSRTVQLEMRRKDGTTVWAEVRASFIRDENQQIMGILGVTRDITERKRTEKQLQDTLESLRKAVGTTIQAMVSAVETRDPYTFGHQVRSADLARAIATEMGLPQEKIDGIRMAGSIHDIGKLSIPAEILSKPTKLSEIEFSMIKEHARQGFEILKSVESSWPLAEVVYQHHERMDGSGYPRHLKGEEILTEARILAVADVVEAMASHRPYRPALGLNAGLEEIENNKGTLYDADAVDACLRLFREKGFQLEGPDYKVVIPTARLSQKLLI